MLAYEKLNKISFPNYTGAMVNMMPIIMRDAGSVPQELHNYLPLINGCGFKSGETVYLSVHESIVKAGETQRRPGIHTDAYAGGAWGGWGGHASAWGGGWGGNSGKQDGIYLASTDGRCRIWDCLHFDVDNHGGGIEGLKAPSEVMEANAMYWMGDRTPHEALPADCTGPRQWFRLVGPEIGGWFTKHNTPNPLGILPKAPLLNHDKFAG